MSFPHTMLKNKNKMAMVRNWLGRKGLHYLESLTETEIVRELMAKNNSEHIKSEDVLLWFRQIEAQRAQAAILNDITEVQKI